MKYLKINDNYIFQGGFAHAFNNVINLIITCYLKDLIPIIPNFNLDPKHNNNKKNVTDFSKYYDYNSVSINGNKIKIITQDNIDKINKDDILIINPGNVAQTHLRWHKYFKIPNDKEIIISPEYVRNSVETVHYLYIYSLLNMETQKKNWDNYKIPDFNKLTTLELNIPFNKEIIDIGNNIIDKYLMNDYVCVHARRGDDVNILIEEKLEYLNKYTEQEHILYKLDANKSPKNVYIMMHPLNKDKYKKDKLIENKKYNIFFSENIEIINKISKDDNNVLYCIENYIMSKAKIKISTYRHYLTKFGNNRKIYDDYLTEVNNENDNNFSFPYLYYN